MHILLVRELEMRRATLARGCSETFGVLPACLPVSVVGESTLLLLLPSFMDIRTQCLPPSNLDQRPAALPESSRCSMPSGHSVFLCSLPCGFAAGSLTNLDSCHFSSSASSQDSLISTPGPWLASMYSHAQLVLWALRIPTQILLLAEHTL